MFRDAGVAVTAEVWGFSGFSTGSKSRAEGCLHRERNLACVSGQSGVYRYVL